MELIAAGGETLEFSSSDFDEIRDQLAGEFGDEGSSMRVVTVDVTDEETQRRRTRIRGLVRATLKKLGIEVDVERDPVSG